MRTFMHYRKYNRQGQIESRGGLTLAVNLDGRAIHVAMAECGRKDNFDRKRGRMIAEGRLNNDKFVVLALPDEIDTSSPALVNAVKSYLHNQPLVKDKVKKLLAGSK